MMTNELTNSAALPSAGGPVPLGEALLRLAQARFGTVTERDREAMRALMRAYAEASAAGSVCVLADGWLAAWNEERARWGQPPLEEKDFDAAVESLSKLHLLGEKRPDLPLVTDEFPWVRDGARFYPMRAFEEEAALARRLMVLARRERKAPSDRVLAELDRLTDAIRADRHQKGAVRKALDENLALISGGPGTGKTTSVVLMLECLLTESPDLRIFLAAPTGKATSRMMQSIQGSVASERLEALLPRMRAVLAGETKGCLEARTLHKWLVTRTASGERPSEENPLACDVLIADEASMVDVRLASRLLEAVSPATRLIILGDKFQLAAVGPGSVFADLSDAHGALGKSVAELKTSRRFREGTVIWRLARAINQEGFTKAQAQEAPDAVVGILRAAEADADGYLAAWAEDEPDPVTGLSPSAEAWIGREIAPYLEALTAYCRGVPKEPESEPLLWEALWTAWQRFRPLAAQRRGLQSVGALNACMERWVKKALNDAGEFDERFDGRTYPGRVVIVRRNDDALGLFNGDVGIVVPTPSKARDPDERPQRTVVFGDSGRRIAPSLLPAHDTAFAMTIHQSQGSEFEHVAVFLPERADSGLATRELLYTGVTRTKRTVTIFGAETTLRRSVERPTERVGGLAERLREYRNLILYEEAGPMAAEPPSREE